MTRLGVVFWGGLVLASGFATFNVKYAVQSIDDELARVRRQTIADQQEIRVLSAEWAYLNQPERLAQLNQNLLQLAPMTTKQLQGRVEEIALRVPRAPGADAAPQTMMAATPSTEPSRIETLLAAASAVPPLSAASSRTVRAGEAPAASAQVAGGAAHAAGATGTETVGAEAQLADMASDTRSADADRAVALAEALSLLGIDAGALHPQNWWAKAAPIATAHAAEARGGDAKGGGTGVADVAAGATRTADTAKDAAAALAEAVRVLGGDSGGQSPRVRLAKASPASLDMLISKIADSH